MTTAIEKQALLIEQFCDWADLPEEMHRLTPEHLKAAAGVLRGQLTLERMGATVDDFEKRLEQTSQKLAGEIGRVDRMIKDLKTKGVKT